MLLLSTFRLYRPALSVPFYLDDFNGILDNYFLRDLPVLWSGSSPPRGFTNLTFAVNYRLSAFSLFPLHLTNIAIHAGCGCLVFLLLCHWFPQRHLPLLGALLFIAHPLQAHVVTYLVQRATSLATFFILLALLLHLRTRTALAAGNFRTSPPFRPGAGAGVVPCSPSGVAWFFLGLAIESTLIPLEPLFDHRLNLPMVGFLLVLFDLLLGQLPLPQVRLFLVAAVVVAALLTWQRNQLWNDPIVFYEENQKHASPSERVSSPLATLYRKAGRMDDARRQIEMMRQILPPGPNPYHQEVILFYAEIGEARQALQLVEEGVRLRPHDPETYKSGALYWQKRQQPQAAMDFHLRGLAANPEDGKIYDMIGELALDQGENVRAEEAFRNSIRRGQGTVATYPHLGEALYRLGRMKEALAQRLRQRDP